MKHTEPIRWHIMANAHDVAKRTGRHWWSVPIIFVIVILIERIHRWCLA
jgi:hypothetical protein